MEKSEFKIKFSIENILKKNDNKPSKRSSINLQKLQVVKPPAWLRNTPSSRALLVIQNEEYSSIKIACHCCEPIEDNLKCNERCFKERLKMRRIGHPYQSRAPPKNKPPRNTFTQLQINQLELLFERTKYLSSSERMRVAKRLQMTDNQLKTWYQNRRTKLKREINELKEHQLRLSHMRK